MSISAYKRNTGAYTVINIAYCGLFIAVGILLPFITGSNRQLGNMLCLMHIPVMLCGLMCPWQCSLAVGIITPLLRSFTLGMPPLFPSALCMAAELSCYGLVLRLMRRLLPRKMRYSYIALIIAMVCGRIVSLLGNLLCSGISGNVLDLPAYLYTVFVTALPGMLLQLAIVPPLARRLDR